MHPQSVQVLAQQRHRQLAGATDVDRPEESHISGRAHPASLAQGEPHEWPGDRRETTGAGDGHVADHLPGPTRPRRRRVQLPVRGRGEHRPRRPAHRRGRATVPPAGRVRARRPARPDRDRAGFAAVAEPLGMRWSLRRSADTARWRCSPRSTPTASATCSPAGRSASCPGRRRVVISNHPDHADLAAAHGVPFHHLPVTAEHPGRAGAGDGGHARRGRGRSGGAGALHAGAVRRRSSTASRTGSSTSTTRSCPRSPARGRTTRRTPEG